MTGALRLQRLHGADAAPRQNSGDVVTSRSRARPSASRDGGRRAGRDVRGCRISPATMACATGDPVTVNTSHHGRSAYAFVVERLRRLVPRGGLVLTMTPPALAG